MTTQPPAIRRGPEAARRLPAGRRLGLRLAATALLTCPVLYSVACDPAVWLAPAPGDIAGSTAFIDVSDRLGDEGDIRGWGGLAAFDYDNDGDIDLLTTNGPGTPNRLFRNDGHARFTELAGEAGLSFAEDNCAACAVGDWNNDGRLDLILGRQRLGVPDGAAAGPILLMNNGPDASGHVTFSRLTAAQTGLSSAAPANAIGVGDLDNDGLLDLLIGRYDMSVIGLLEVPLYESQPNELWRCTGVSDGVPRFERVTTAGIEGTAQNGFSPDTADQTFIPGTLVLYMTDVDGDGWLDFFDCHDIPGGVDYFHNNRDLTFTRRQVGLLNKHGGWMGMAGGDYDADGDIDYFITNVGCDFSTLFPPDSVSSAHTRKNGAYFHRLLRNDGGYLVDVTAATRLTPSVVLPPTNALGGSGLQAAEFGFGTTWIDTDNRGRLDLYWVGDLITTLNPALNINWHGVGRFLTNNGDGTFTDRTAERGLFNIPPDKRVAFGQQEAGRALAACDLNGDGFQDLVVTNASMLGTPDARARLFLNPASNGNHWLTVRLEGSDSNRFGIGARVIATAGGKTRVAEVLSTTSAFLGLQPQAHFGLADADRVDTLEVRWPSGRVTILNDVAVDRVLTVSE